MSNDKHVTIHLTAHGFRCALGMREQLIAVAGCDIAFSPFATHPFMVVYSRNYEVINKLERYFSSERVETSW